MLAGLVKGQGVKKSVNSKEVPVVKDDSYYRKVAEKAYALYEKRGCEHGSDLGDWFQAEKEIENAIGASAAGLKPKRSAKRF